jgi:hypothetical protein
MQAQSTQKLTASLATNRMNSRSTATYTTLSMMMEDAKFYHKDFYAMYADFKGAFNAADTASCSNTCANSVCPPPLPTHANTYTVSLQPNTLSRTAPPPP